MNKLLVIIASAMMLMPVAGHADNEKSINNKITLLNDDMDSLRLSFVTGELITSERTFLGQRYSTLSIADYTPSASVGFPELPVFSQFIEVPLCKGFDVRISDAVYDTIDAPQLTVLPNQPP